MRQSLARHPELAHPEVEHLDEVNLPLVHGRETVGWLQIAMDDAAHVGGLQGAKDLEGEVNRTGNRQSRVAVVAKDDGEIAPLEQLHNEVRNARGKLTDVEDRDDVFGRDGRRRHAFSEKSSRTVLDAYHFGLEELERYGRASHEVKSANHGPHSTRREDLFNQVFPIYSVARQR